jgi:hypothetical protein
VTHEKQLVQFKTCAREKTATFFECSILAGTVAIPLKPYNKLVAQYHFMTLYTWEKFHIFISP